MKRNLLRILSICLVFVLVTASAITFTSCNEKENEKTGESNSESVAEKAFTLEVTFADGKVEKRECKSSAEMLGTYLVDEKIVEGEKGDYGIMISSVLGETHDSNVEKSYWAFYIDGEYAMTSVDSTPIEEGKVYALKVEAFE